jgi:hypothetical protein
MCPAESAGAASFSFFPFCCSLLIVPFSSDSAVKSAQRGILSIVPFSFFLFHCTFFKRFRGKERQRGVLSIIPSMPFPVHCSPCPCPLFRQVCSGERRRSICGGPQALLQGQHPPHFCQVQAPGQGAARHGLLQGAGKAKGRGLFRKNGQSSLKPIGYTWSYLACRIRHLVHNWQPQCAPGKTGAILIEGMGITSMDWMHLVRFGSHNRTFGPKLAVRLATLFQ